ncbi:MAG: shikimate kinase [Pseudomonadota bacterium]
MAFHLKKSVVLVGMMGSGKTSVGRTLARALDVPFVDSDHEIETASSYQIPELFQRFGEVYFREKETQVLLRLLQDEPRIIATGGGAYMNQSNQVNISKFGIAVWLNAELNLLWARVKGSKNRPLLHTDDPYQTLSEINKTRAKIYAQAPIHVAAHSYHSPKETARDVVRALVKRPDVLERVNDNGNGSS